MMVIKTIYKSLLIMHMKCTIMPTYSEGSFAYFVLVLVCQILTCIHVYNVSLQVNAVVSSVDPSEPTVSIVWIVPMLSKV